MQRSHAGEPVGHLGPGGYTYTSPLTRPFSALQRQNTGGSRGYKKTPHLDSSPRQGAYRVS